MATEHHGESLYFITRAVIRVRSGVSRTHHVPLSRLYLRSVALPVEEGNWVEAAAIKLAAYEERADIIREDCCGGEHVRHGTRQRANESPCVETPRRLCWAEVHPRRRIMDKEKDVSPQVQADLGRTTCKEDAAAAFVAKHLTSLNDSLEVLYAKDIPAATRSHARLVEAVHEALHAVIRACHEAAWAMVDEAEWSRYKICGNDCAASSDDEGAKFVDNKHAATIDEREVDAAIGTHPVPKYYFAPGAPPLGTRKFDSKCPYAASAVELARAHIILDKFLQRCLSPDAISRGFQMTKRFLRYGRGKAVYPDRRIAWLAFCLDELRVRAHCISVGEGQGHQDLFAVDVDGKWAANEEDLQLNERMNEGGGQVRETVDGRVRRRACSRGFAGCDGTSHAITISDDEELPEPSSGGKRPRWSAEVSESEKAADPPRRGAEASSSRVQQGRNKQAPQQNQQPRQHHQHQQHQQQWYQQRQLEHRQLP